MDIEAALEGGKISFGQGLGRIFSLSQTTHAMAVVLIVRVQGEETTENACARTAAASSAKIDWDGRSRDGDTSQGVEPQACACRMSLEALLDLIRVAPLSDRRARGAAIERIAQIWGDRRRAIRAQLVGS